LESGKKYDQIQWSTDADYFDKWCTEFTGFPIADAGMGQLNTTEWMHNHIRMVISSFLTKSLRIDW